MNETFFTNWNKNKSFCFSLQHTFLPSLRPSKVPITLPEPSCRRVWWSKTCNKTNGWTITCEIVSAPSSITRAGDEKDVLELMVVMVSYSNIYFFLLFYPLSLSLFSPTDLGSEWKGRGAARLRDKSILSLMLERKANAGLFAAFPFAVPTWMVKGAQNSCCSSTVGKRSSVHRPFWVARVSSNPGINFSDHKKSWWGAETICSHIRQCGVWPISTTLTKYELLSVLVLLL